MDRGAISEVLGAVILIGVVALGMVIVNLVIFTQPNTTVIPHLEASITNQSTLIIIVHQGGDSLQAGQFQILVDGGDQTANFTNSGSYPWSIGETLSNTTPNMPHHVVLVYNGTGAGGGVVLLETYLP